MSVLAVPSKNQIDDLAAAKGADGRLFVFVIGGDRQVYNRWQTDPAAPDTWSDWSSLGRRQIQAGIGLGATPTRELELFVIGGDGKLYRRPRPGAEVLFAQEGTMHMPSFAIDRPRELLDIHARARAWRGHQRGVTSRRLQRSPVLPRTGFAGQGPGMIVCA